MLGIYVRQNNRYQNFELVQEDDGFVYDRKFNTERQANAYLKRIESNLKKYIKSN